MQASKANKELLVLQLQYVARINLQNLKAESLKSEGGCNAVKTVLIAANDQYIYLNWLCLMIE